MNSLLKSSKKLLVGIGLASCGAAVWAYLGVTEDKALLKATALYEQYIKNQRFFLEPVHATTLKWDFNWDKHHADPFSKTPDGRFLSEEEEKEFKDKLDKAKVTASRHLLLIRHGQYNLSGLTDAERILTDLGRQQAHFAAQRLKSLDLPYTRLVQSTMTRAAETASIISKELPDVPVEQSDLLREGMPAIPEPSESLKDCYDRLARDGPRIEAAFRRYFHRASPLQKQDSYEIFVCHANVIRYFVCRALQLAPEAWLRFSLHNCSLTWITIRPGGKVVVYTVGDCGYIPPDKLSTT